MQKIFQKAEIWGTGTQGVARWQPATTLMGRGRWLWDDDDDDDDDDVRVCVIQWPGRAVHAVHTHVIPTSIHW